MRACLTLVATAILSSLAAAAPMTDNVDGKLIGKVISPQVGSMKDVDLESALFKRDEKRPLIMSKEWPLDRVEDVKKLSGGNFAIERELDFLRNTQGAMTGVAEKNYDLGELDFAGKDLVKGMILISVEMFALFNVQGHADTSNPRFAEKYDEIKSRIASLMEGAKDEFLITHTSRDLFEKYTRRVNYSMREVTRSM